MRWLSVFLGISTALFAGPFDEMTPSTPEEIASLNTDLLIDGFVSAVSGQLALSEEDLRVKGAQDVMLKRVYIPPQIFGRYHRKDEEDKFALGMALAQLHVKGWAILPHLLAGYNQHSPYFQLRDPQGCVLEFFIENDRGTLKNVSYGCSNLRGSEPNSAADIRNIEFIVEGNQAKVTWPDGVQRIYARRIGTVYQLIAEMLPNGKVIRYSYDGGNLNISATDKSGKFVYASIQRVAGDHYRGSDGREVKLFYEVLKIKGKIKEEKGKTKGRFQFPVMKRSSNPFYSNTAGYDERMLLTQYDTKAYPISCSYLKPGAALCRVGTFSDPAKSLSFSYDPPIPDLKGGSTTVTYPDGLQMIYRFNQKLLLTSVENWYEGELYNQKTFAYNDGQHVIKTEMKDGKGNLLLTKLYECDLFGNPLVETHITDCGTFSIKRAFSKFRLLSEERDDGFGFAYTYLGDTHLVLSKTTLAHGKQVRKTSYVYDEACNLIEEREEGRTITTYTLYQTSPHLHRVQWKEERDWEGSLIRKVKYSYDRYGNLAQEDYYGSDGAFSFTILKTYDEKGNLIREANPLNQLAEYRYDERSRPVQEIPFSRALTIDRAFDAKGRLVCLKEGEHKTSFVYNAFDELIEKTNYLGLKTTTSYHPVHRAPILTEAHPTREEIQYDAFGRVTQRKDAYGATTRIKQNSYGDPLEIIYPDGGKETFVYAPNGSLLQSIDPDGLSVFYTRDPLGRVISEKIGEVETTYLYDGYHLLEEKDPLGHVTSFTYNLAGQQVEERRAGRVSQFTYDPLGFLESETRADRRRTFRNDALGRVLEKSIDGVLTTRYTYDVSGNVASISKVNTTYFSYDPYNRLIETIDPEGAKTTISYEERDQKWVKKITDPRGVQTLETYNAHNLLLTREIPDALLEEFHFDNVLRLISHDHLTFTYTPQGFKASMTEAGQRTTYWTYTPGGKLQSEQKPDGTRLIYEYNSQGELTKVGSREFQYDRLGRLIQGTGFIRQYDPFGNVIREELENGLTLQTTYNPSNRPLTRVLPDQSSILYEYKGPFLKKVSRLDGNGDLLYAHTYEEFDPDGHVLVEKGSFETSYTYDRVGRRTSQSCPHFSEELSYDLAGNLLRKGKDNYTYDGANQLTSSADQFILSYDAHYNRTSYNNEPIVLDELNQIKGLPYDESGRLIQPGFVFDEFDQLIQAGGEQIVYDALGRRLQKGATSYLYFGEEEVGAFENGFLTELKIPGSLAPIAVEIKNQPYEPIVDIQGTIRLLIDPKTASIYKENTCDPFGGGLNSDIPYGYVGKRYDPHTGLIYFGKRYYVPSLGRWLTQDPLGTIDHSNLYQYVFNNPYRFQDPNGENVLGYMCGLGEILLGGTIIATGLGLEVITFGGFTFGLGVTTGTGAIFISHGLVMTTLHAQDISSSKYSPRYSSSPSAPLDSPMYGPDQLLIDQGLLPRTAKEGKEPPYSGKELGSDPAACPGENFEWLGEGKPGSRKGSWYNSSTGESLHPDLDHPPPIKPHWDYKGSGGEKARLHTDGTWEWK